MTYGAEVITEHDVSEGTEEYEIQLVMYSFNKPEYVPIWTISLLKNLSGSYRAVLVEGLDKGEENDVELLISDSEFEQDLAKKIVKEVSIVLLQTRYPSTPCFEQWLDGYNVQVYIPNVSGFGALAGEAYIPIENSGPDLIVQIGREIKELIEGADSNEELNNLVAELERHNKPLTPIASLTRTRMKPAPLS